jgi:hypothetical protein
MAAWIAGGEVLASIAAGAVSPNFEADNPRRSVRTSGSALSLALTVGFALVSMALFAYWVLVGLGRVSPSRTQVIIVSAVLLWVLAVVSAIIFGLLAHAVRRLEAWEPA